VIQVPGYTILGKIDETVHSVIFRARAEGGGPAVVVKALKARYPSPTEIIRLKHEYELIRQISSDGIVEVIGLVEIDDGLALVMEDFDGVPLSGLIGQGFTQERFLEIAISLASALGGIHAQGVFHRDIKPGNILIGRQDSGIKITDFGIAAEILGKNREIYNPGVMEVTLAYLSPEQTGRMNQSLDYRTDLYSLGVTFYEMLTGQVPFMSPDPMEIIHAHIARQPVPPAELNPEVSPMVSAMVMRLLAKSPEDRYQSCEGLEHDLRKCLERLETRGAIEPFPLGARDVSRHFTVPQTLVGRDEQLSRLSRTFERTASGSVEVMLVSGEPGIGKTVLVNEIRKPIIGRRGFFITGKYDQYRRHVPHSAILQAFSGLARQLMAESGARLDAWRAKILNALGPNGKIITDAVPETVGIIGSQPDIPELGPEETLNRFQIVFKSFLRAFASEQHPLVLFLDDLQWADSASLSLLKAILTDRTLTHILLIGAYRDTETPAHHPMMLGLGELREQGVTVAIEKLEALTPTQVNQLIAGFLRCDPELSEPLARLVHGKTLGNPFFVNQFLKNLYEEGALVLDEKTGWRWNIELIRNMQVTDNVVDFMAAKIVRLPHAQQELIKVCACMGSRFDLDTLAGVTQQPIHEILSSLTRLIGQGLVSYGEEVYRFHHDRIQEAAYSLIDDEERARVHYRIGRRLLATVPTERLAGRIFYIADQYNQAHDLIKSPEEREAVAGLNLKAGLRAKDSTAYAAAAGYLKAGMALLPSTAWKDRYSLTYALNLERMECAYLSRKFEEAQQLFEDIIAHSRNKVDRARAYATMVTLYTNIGKLSEAISLGIEGLRMFGERFSPRAGKLSVARELALFQMKIRKIGIENVLDLAMSTDNEILWRCELIGALGLPAYYSNPNLFAVAVLRGVRRDLRDGLANTSAFGFVAIATIISSALGDYTTANRMGEMALRLNEKLGAKRYACKVSFISTFFLMHWIRPLRDTLDRYRRAYRLGLESGDLIYCGHSVTAMLMSRVIMGDNLDSVLAEAQSYKDFIAGLKDPFNANQLNEIVHICLHLKGLTRGPHNPDTGDYCLEELLSAMRRQGNLLHVFFSLLVKERVLFLCGKFEEARIVGDEMDTMLEVPTGSFHLAEHVFLRCMCLLAVCPGKGAREKKRLLAQVSRHMKKVERWAELAPANCGHRALLIRAETAAVLNRSEEAADLFQKAVESAREHGYTNIEALANERAALFYFGKGNRFVGRAYLREAHHAYERWGATMKTRQLEQAYPGELRHERTEKTQAEGDSLTSTVHASAPSSLLDLATVMKVSQAISSEIMLDRLMRTIMKMAVVNAGAQRGFLLLDNDGRLTVEAGEEDREDAPAINSLPLEECDFLCASVVNYVHNSGESIILGNASREDAFQNDPYVIARQCRSILCAPILNKGRLLGIIYMENNLSPNAFTAEHIELLRILLAQAAISLENAKLYELATTDGLTRLFVHRYFHLLLTQELARSRRHDKQLSLIMIDIDDFKNVNDTYGHQLGDEVLKNVARTMKGILRAEDVVARYGGEEFAVILPETGAAQAAVAAEKIRRMVEMQEIRNGDRKLHVTISLGVATFPEHALNKDDLILCADTGLYTAKRSGKNRVCVCEAASPEDDCMNLP
jgi:diguanylate cyclase (GGDEF)-like protein